VSRRPTLVAMVVTALGLAGRMMEGFTKVGGVFTKVGGVFTKVGVSRGREGFRAGEDLPPRTSLHRS